jgi:hypothetical protein
MVARRSQVAVVNEQAAVVARENRARARREKERRERGGRKATRWFKFPPVTPTCLARLSHAACSSVTGGQATQNGWTASRATANGVTQSR